MRTVTAADDGNDDLIKRYRLAYRSSIVRVASVIRKAGQFGGRK